MEHRLPAEKASLNARPSQLDSLSFHDPPSMKRRRMLPVSREADYRQNEVKEEEDDDDDDEEDDAEEEEEEEDYENGNARFVDCDEHSRNDNNMASEQDSFKCSYMPSSADDKTKILDSLVTNVAGIPEYVLEATKVHLEIKTSKRPSTISGSTANGDFLPKKPKKKPVNVWAKASSRKGGKKSSKTNSKMGLQRNSKNSSQLTKENCVYLIPAKNQSKIEDGPGMPVLLSKFHKSERIELSEDRLIAGSTKGYRMVRATRGVTTGAWYFEISIENLGKTGHTRLGWSTQKGELQAPVGFDAYSYGYRDIDGSKIHMAVREPYGEPYVEGDVIGFYINLPNGDELAPKPASLVSYKGHPYIIEEKEEPQQVVPDSEIAFLRNGVFQGAAFKGIIAGRYFPAASMYTLPNEPNCTVRFNFGPEFRFPVTEMANGRPIPQAFCLAPHCSLDSDSASTNDFKGVTLVKH